jgi:hypothetical protein
MSITLVRGDTEHLRVTVTDADGDTVNLTGADAWFTVKRRVADPDDRAAIALRMGAGIEVEDAPGGVLIVTLTATETDDMVPGVYRYDVQVRDANGRISTVADGRLVLRSDVTRATV